MLKIKIQSYLKSSSRLLSETEMNDYSIALLSMAARNVGNTDAAEKYSKMLVSSMFRKWANPGHTGAENLALLMAG